MPFFDTDPTAPTEIVKRLRRALAQNRAARAARDASSGAPRCVPDPADEPGNPPRTTVDATIRPVGTGRYRRLDWAPGEPHRLRADLGGDTSPERPGRRRSLSYFAQHTDLHVCDAQAEARLVGGQAFGWLHPGTDAGHRPQETMSTQVLDQLIRATNRVRISPISGASMTWCAQTGDHTDNRTAAEVGWWLDTLAGRTVTPNTGAPGVYEGVQRSGWRTVWNPDVRDRDRCQRHGYPFLPGVLDAAVAPFQAEGLAMPWLACQGNHDRIFSGTFGAGRGVRIDLVESMVRDSGRAPVTGLGLARAVLAASITRGDSRRWGRGRPGRGVVAVCPDPEARRPVRDTEVRTSIIAEGAAGDGPGPIGHGFDPDHPTDWWSLPEGERIQIINLDTTNHVAGEGGRLGPLQTAWLEAELARHHRRHLDVDGNWVDGTGDDRLVVISSHHNSWVMDNEHDDPVDPGPATDGPALVQLLARFPNVILWFNGHSHQHRITPHRRGRDRGGRRLPGGFWEISTSSLVGFPQQGRTFEIFDNADETISIVTTVVDHAAPPTVAYATPGNWTPTALASLSRELAANDDRWLDPLEMLGSIDDRNAELLLPAPFALP